MSTDEETLKAELAALEVEFEGILASYLDAIGWKALFRMLARLAEQRQDGRIAGIMQAAQNFLSEKG